MTFTRCFVRSLLHFWLSKEKKMWAKKFYWCKIKEWFVQGTLIDEGLVVWSNHPLLPALLLPLKKSNKTPAHIKTANAWHMGGRRRWPQHWLGSCDDKARQCLFTLASSVASPRQTDWTVGGAWVTLEKWRVSGSQLLLLLYCLFPIRKTLLGLKHKANYWLFHPTFIMT